MADEKKQQKLKHPRKSPLGLSPKDLASSIPMLLWKLGDALGCKRSRLEYGKAFIKPKTHMQIKLNDFRQRFKQLQSTTDVEEQCLQEHRYKLFLHLYRLLLRLEPNETKRQEYLAFCYHMFDEKNPQKMQLEGKLKYQEDFTENLICLAQSVLHLNEKELEISSSREQTETILQMGFCYVICKPVLNRCQLKCLRWERAICVKNYNPMNRNANKEEPKLIRDTELKIIYMAHPKSSEQSSPLSSDVMDCEDIESELRAFSQGWKLNAAEKNSKPFSFLKGHYGKVTQFMAPAQTVEFYKNRKSVCLTSDVSSQLAEPLQTVEVFMNCKSINETSEIGSQIIDPNAFVLSNKSQQTETSTMQLDQGVQTYRNEVSTDIATNTDDLHTGQSKNRINSEMVASTIASESKAHKIYKLPNGLVKQRESTITNNLSTQVDFSQCPSSVNELRQNFILTTSEEMLPDIVYTTIQEEQTNDSSTVLHKSLNSISTLPQENLASISGQFKDWIYTASEEMLPEINQPIIQQELVPSMTKIQRGLITSDPTHNGEPPIRMLSTRETIDVAPMKSASIYELASISIGDTSEVQQKQEVIPEKPKQEQIKCSEHDFCNWQAQRAPSIIHKSIADSLHDEPIPVNFYLKQISDASSWQDEQLSNIDESIQEKSIFSIEIDKSLISDKCLIKEESIQEKSIFSIEIDKSLISDKFLIKEDISKQARAQSGEVLSVKFPEIDNSMSVKKLVDNQSINDQEPSTATEDSRNAIGELQQPNQSISHRSSSSMDSSKEEIGEFQQSECQPECKSNELKTESHLSTEPKQLSSAMESKQVLDETDRSVVPESNNGNESKAVSPSISKQKLEPLTDTLGMLVLTTEMLAKIHKQLAQLRMMPNRSTSSCQGKRQQKTKKSFESLSTTALESIPESSTQNETDKNIETITKVQEITDNVSRISDIPTESPSIVNDDTLAATAKCESKLESKDASSSKTSLLEINLSIYHQDCILDGSGSKTKLGPLKVTESEIIFRHLEVASKLSIPIDQLEPLVNSTTKETSILYTPVNFHLNKMEIEEESKQSLPEINSSICQQDVIPAAESITQHTPKEEEDVEQARGDQPQMASTTTTSKATPITAECSLSNSTGLETGAKSKEILPQNKKRIKFDYQSMASDSSQASEPLIDTHKIITDIRKFIKMLHPVDQAKLIADKPITEEKSVAIEKTTCYQNQKLEHVEEAVKRSPEIEPNLDNQSISQNETLMCKVSENGMDEDIDRLREKNCAAIDKVSKFNESITPTLIVSPAKWQHQRYIIAASRFIIKQFKCNPAYQCSALQPDAPDFYEQWKQFIEIAAAQASCPKPTIDVANIKRRLKLYLRCMRKQYLYQPEECLAAIGKCQLQQLLTKEELEEYERLRWQQRDRGMTVKLNAEERLVDAQHALLGYECQQLRASARSTRLMLRSPHHQSSISESYLLLALAEVGHYYRCLQQQHDLLPQQLGEYGRALTPCLMAELHAYSRFYQCHKEQGTSLIQVYQQSRRYIHRFQWLLHLCDELNRHQSPLQYLQQQLGLGCGDYDEVLKQWIQCAAEPLLKRIRSWLQLGELLPGDFFIVDTGGQIENYWLEQFELLPEQLPHFINKYLAQQLLATGRNQHFARHFLGRQLELVVQESELQQQLAAACVSSYREMDEQPLIELLGTLQLDTSRQLFEQLQQLRPDPLELLTRLHQYLLLTDVEFVREMIELLEPVLEQPAECYCAVQLNNMLEQLLGVYNKPLYVVKGEQQGSRCWCCFLLRWQQPCHWKTLLGGRLRQYESCFVCLWQLHYADYVLNERIRRQQSHFWERINLEQSQEARQVRDRFDQFIDRLQEFMLLLRSYMLENVLDRALAKLYLGCNTVKTLDELLQLQGSYMDRILNGLFLTRDYVRLRLLLVQLYEPIFQLDVVQQKFLSICQLIYADDDTPQRQLKVRSCCQSTCDAIHDLEQDFQLAFANLLLGLYNTNQPQACGLAKKLDRRGYYEQRYKELKIVHTFRYQRKFQIQKNSRLANL